MRQELTTTTTRLFLFFSNERKGDCLERLSERNKAVDIDRREMLIPSISMVSRRWTYRTGTHMEYPSRVTVINERPQGLL
jgi:hypothetical protein